jgi:hypothetical protein
MQQKRDEANREKAAEIRRKAEEVELDAREKEARASRARADAEQAQVQAARLKQEAEQKSNDARSLREDVARHTEKANSIDPDVRADGDAGRGRDDGMSRDAVNREGAMGQDATRRDAVDRDTHGDLRRESYPDGRREAAEGAVGGTRQTEPRAENLAETQQVEGSERVQAEELRRRRERTEGDTPGSAI